MESNFTCTGVASLTEIDFEIFTFDNLYTNNEIEKHIQFIDNDKNSRCFTKNNFKNGKTELPTLSCEIYNRIKQFLPEIYTDRNGTKWKFISCCDYIFYSQLNKNEVFDIHTDTGSVFDRENGLFSKFTLLTYLNDEFDGGKTEFYDDNLNKTVTVTPTKGKTVAFDIDLYHKGCEVICGKKYWIGTEIVCKKIF